MASVYCIENTTNGFKYIGSTVNKVNSRWIDHKWLLNKNTHHSKSLQDAWSTDGAIAFNFYIIEDNIDDEVCREHEDYYVKFYKTLDRQFGYNEREPLFGGGLLRFSDEQRQRLSNSRKGEGNPFYGKSHTDEARQKMSESRTGKQTKENNHNYGKSPSDETRKKIGDANKGKTRSDETKGRISESLKGENNWNYGKSPSEETRQKKGEASQGEKSYSAKLTEAQVIEIIELLKQDELTQREIARRYNISRSAINKISNGTKWKYLPR